MVRKGIRGGDIGGGGKVEFGTKECPLCGEDLTTDDGKHIFLPSHLPECPNR